jgi:hypothetical protein
LSDRAEENEEKKKMTTTRERHCIIRPGFWLTIRNYELITNVNTFFVNQRRMFSWRLYLLHSFKKSEFFFSFLFFLFSLIFGQNQNM